VIEILEAAQQADSDLHDHLWQRLSPESRYGLVKLEYRCQTCGLSWSG
jgi:hypothetical protein